jgi:hypothetical protein
VSGASKQSTKAAREAQSTFERRERIGATWYVYELAVQGLVPGKPYYLLPEAEREELRARGEAVGKTLVVVK